MHFSPEFSFVVDCCRSCFVGSALGQSSPDRLNKARVVRLARFHRVQGLVWRAVNEAGPADLGELQVLRGDASVIAAENLKAAAECTGILADCERAGLQIIFLKGLTLGALAYGSAALKAAVDVDLLIGPGEVRRAAELLDARGYRLLIPGSLQSLERWHRIRKESVWLQPTSGVQLDLHTRVADNRMMIPTIGIGSDLSRVDIGNGVDLPTLSPVENFAYLAVHGASSAWFRLKWISDFAALLAATSANHIEKLYGQSLELGAGRAPAQALLLADRLFGSLANNTALRNELLAHRTNRVLFDAALKQLAGRSDPLEPTSRALGTLRIHWTQFLLMPGLGFKSSELWRQARNSLA
jgi:hypothetical protein